MDLDTLYVAYNVPTIGICRAEQREKACQKLGIPAPNFNYDMASPTYFKVLWSVEEQKSVCTFVWLIGLNWVAVHGNDHLLFLFVTRGGWPASWIYAMCFVCSLQASGSINAVALGLNAVQANIYCINPSAPPMLTQGSCLQLHRGFCEEESGATRKGARQRGPGQPPLEPEEQVQSRRGTRLKASTQVVHIEQLNPDVLELSRDNPGHASTCHDCSIRAYWTVVTLRSICSRPTLHAQTKQANPPGQIKTICVVTAESRPAGRQEQSGGAHLHASASFTCWQEVRICTHLHHSLVARGAHLHAIAADVCTCVAH
eukprot:1161745-Pelagomonas_calceolata.AAC.1